MEGEQRGPVVRHADEVAVEEWDDPHHGRLRFRSLFDAAATPTDTMTAGIAELAPGGWLAVHSHPQPEVYHVLEGTGLLVAGGVERTISTGDSVFLPAGVEHGISHADGPLLRILYTFAVDSLDDVDYAWP